MRSHERVRYSKAQPSANSDHAPQTHTQPKHRATGAGQTSAPLLKFDTLFDGKLEDVFDEEREAETGSWPFLPRIPNEYAVGGIRVYSCLMPIFCAALAIIIVLFGIQVMDKHEAQAARFAEMVQAKPPPPPSPPSPPSTPPPFRRRCSGRRRRRQSPTRRRIR